jgi:hypothetical protein
LVRSFDYLFETINPEEFEHVNMVVEGFVEDSIFPVLELSAEETHIEFWEHLVTLTPSCGKSPLLPTKMN